ncbi:hypothetical protein MJO28_000618 [Puccinia striiformis f. sp. tritici]|uniref:Uncharacterized protein n=3 Tax=Puccinia striiformis TaxID=27350 RepID=A0A0L0W5W2_9BASI|nr:hypothetical protein MJO28_000618 [Puccinia striiformis f. sp. tritici]KNF06881.1 hypothetical protein PSTG_00197 [Puccinia striiformis f. sp. tritici PST-78]POW00199.1 hypothetical protein PSHT_13155 [Puccinia striiformis]
MPGHADMNRRTELTSELRARVLQTPGWHLARPVNGQVLESLLTDGEKLADPQPINQDQGDNYWKTGM